MVVILYRHQRLDRQTLTNYMLLMFLGLIYQETKSFVGNSTLYPSPHYVGHVFMISPINVSTTIRD